MDDAGDVVENLIEVERGSRGFGDFEQEVEEVGAFFKANIAVGGFWH